MGVSGDEDGDYGDFLRRLYRVAVERVNPYGMIINRITIRNGTLTIQNSPITLRLSDYRHILIIG
ncbi:MAG: hypothetical protein ACR2PY_00265, partial [Salinispira sp.]